MCVLASKESLRIFVLVKALKDVVEKKGRKIDADLFLESLNTFFAGFREIWEKEGLKKKVRKK